MYRLWRTIVFLTVTFFGWGGSPEAEKPWAPPDSLVGTWEGTSRVFSVPGAESGVDTVRVRITILPDGTVQGNAGGAVFVQCRVGRNRGWLGRKLNIKTDWWIRKGFLEGPIVPGDPETRREIDLPFNMVHGCLRGSLFERKGWRYPNPIFPRLYLRKTGVAGGAEGNTVISPNASASTRP